MPENPNMDELTEARRKSVAETINTMGVGELKTLCEGLFPYVDHPWRERVFTFIRENAGAIFHHAVTHDGVHFIYCHAQNQGLWFLPGSGMGPMQPRGLQIFKEILEGKR